VTTSSFLGMGLDLMGATGVAVEVEGWEERAEAGMKGICSGAEGAVVRSAST